MEILICICIVICIFVCCCVFSAQKNKDGGSFTKQVISAPSRQIFVHKKDNTEAMFDEYDRIIAAHARVHDKANAYIRETMSIGLPLNCGGSILFREKDAQSICDFLTGKANALSGDVFSAKVDGVNTFELLEEKKHDLPLMLRCCEEGVKNMAATGSVAAPFYFRRVAILAKKQKDYELEIKICEIIIKVYEIYAEAYTRQGDSPPLNMEGTIAEFAKRLPAARANLKKQQTSIPKRIKQSRQKLAE